MFIDSYVINTDTPYISVFLSNNHWVGNPSRCFNLFDEPDIFQAMEFGCYGFALWLVEEVVLPAMILDPRLVRA
jgi:hypothetical protein